MLGTFHRNGMGFELRVAGEIFLIEAYPLYWKNSQPGKVYWRILWIPAIDRLIRIRVLPGFLQGLNEVFQASAISPNAHRRKQQKYEHEGGEGKHR